ncbi:Transcriptional regulatory protein, C terminal [Plantibacter flavus]|uniref:Transcriptional regulator n=1 Tax=Plantibacter flavus TaxID=150123 RepID=A0A3N2C4W1_9MICO|nr:transcriptional regulator [Plantibacter flavus]SMG43003.1 Transcriptional regulatory protein, C terminal [Plantibacter flavus]
MTEELSERRTAVVIEDDADIRQLLETVLEQAGFETVSAANGLDGVEAVRTHNPLVTTLDVSMPGIDGFEAAKRIRAISSTYIVMLTARGDEIDTLQGLDSGADDYMTKPFRPRELRARIEAMLRRPRANGDAPAVAAAAPAQPAPTAVAPGPVTQVVQAQVAAPPLQQQVSSPDPTIVHETVARHAAPVGQSVVPIIMQPAAAASDDGEGWLVHRGLKLSSATRIVEVDGTEVDLTRSEFDLLQALMESRRRVRSKADLALMLRGESYITAYYVSEADKRAIEVHLANLRRKLADSTVAPRFIETVRGVGYRMTSDD